MNGSSDSRQWGGRGDSISLSPQGGEGFPHRPEMCALRRGSGCRAAGAHFKPQLLGPEVRDYLLAEEAKGVEHLLVRDGAPDGSLGDGRAVRRRRRPGPRAIPDGALPGRTPLGP